MIVSLVTEHHFEFLNLKGGWRGSSESTLVKMSNCCKSHAAAHIIIISVLDTMSSVQGINRTNYVGYKCIVQTEETDDRSLPCL